MEDGVAWEVLDNAALARGGNALLKAASDSDRRFLVTHAARRTFALGDLLNAADEPSSTIFFIEDGIASILKPEANGRRTEIGIIGTEGFVGTAIIMADGQWPYETIVQVERLTAIAIPGNVVRVLMERSTDFQQALLGAIHLQTIQIAEGLVSATRQPIIARLARWLLMYRDGLQSSRLDVTHAFMALMVGAQRAKVTAALHELESIGAITTRRGSVRIRDAVMLERTAEGSYATLFTETQRLGSQAPTNPPPPPSTD